MSTRCNVVIKGQYSEIILYRHSDGYPDATGADLKDFVKGYTDRSMRLDAMQSAGWLIIRGNAEYNGGSPRMMPNSEDKGYGWKVGAYEPTDQVHSDIDYMYVIDLVERVLKIKYVSKRKTVETVEF